MGAPDLRHIVAVTDYGDIGGAPFLVMEVLEGRSLDEALRSRPFTPEGTLVILRQLAKALATAHGAGLIHRDLKPANVFVCKDDDGSPLVNLSGYRIHYGTSPSSLSKLVTVGSPSSTSASIEGLSSGTWYFAVVAFTTAGIESAMSSSASKTIK